MPLSVSQKCIRPTTMLLSLFFLPTQWSHKYQVPLLGGHPPNDDASQGGSVADSWTFYFKYFKSQQYGRSPSKPSNTYAKLQVFFLFPVPCLLKAPNRRGGLPNPCRVAIRACPELFLPVRFRFGAREFHSAFDFSERSPLSSSGGRPRFLLKTMFHT